MENALVEFGTTMAVGGFVIIAIWGAGLLFGSWKGEEPPKGWKVRPSTKDKSISASLLVPSVLISSFLIGVILEDCSDPFFEWVQEEILVKGKKDFWPERWISQEFTPKLFYQYIDRGIIKKVISEDLRNDLNTNCVATDKQGKQILAELKNCIDELKDEFKKVAQANFHYSKNRAYMESNYYQELNKIQDRINLARSLMFAVIPFSIIFIILFIIALIKSHEGINKKLAYFFILFPLSIGVYYCAYTAYEAEHTAYNKRVFGYGITLFDIEKKQWGTNKKLSEYDCTKSCHR